MRENIYEKLGGILRDVFNDESIIISDSTSSKDIAGWDSLEHANLIASIEREFGIEFDFDEINKLKNIGEMVNIITNKLGKKD